MCLTGRTFRNHRLVLLVIFLYILEQRDIGQLIPPDVKQERARVGVIDCYHRVLYRL